MPPGNWSHRKSCLGDRTFKPSSQTIPTANVPKNISPQWKENYKTLKETRTISENEQKQQRTELHFDRFSNYTNSTFNMLQEIKENPESKSKKHTNKKY